VTPQLGYLFAPVGDTVANVELNDAERAEQYQDAVLGQLNAEMSAKGYNVKTLAAAVGKDYNTFRRWMNGEREIPIRMLWRTIAALGVPAEVFTDRARRRLEQR